MLEILEGFVCHHRNVFYNNCFIINVRLEGLPGWCSQTESAYQCRRHKRCEFDSWLRKIPCSSKWQPTQEMATRSSILAWKIPWTEKPAGLQFIVSQRSKYNWAHNKFQLGFLKKWKKQSTIFFLCLKNNSWYLLSVNEFHKACELNLFCIEWKTLHKILLIWESQTACILVLWGTRRQCQVESVLYRKWLAST